LNHEPCVVAGGTPSVLPVTANSAPGLLGGVVERSPARLTDSFLKLETRLAAFVPLLQWCHS
jgi:hypothetical protein